MKKRLILFSHQLNARYVEESGCDAVHIVLSKEQFEAFNYHKQRIVYHMSAAKHFCETHGFDFVYEDTFKEAFDRLEKDAVYVIYDPVEHGMRATVHKALDTAGMVFEAKSDINFFISDIKAEFEAPPYKLDSLYRRWRHRFDVLIEAGKPIGGRYSFDVKNRKGPPKTMTASPPLSFEADATTRTTIRTVAREFSSHPGEAETFAYPITRKSALKALDHFIAERLPHFGRYQDAMKEDSPFMAHSLLSAPINLGLLFADEVTAKAEQAYHDGTAPIEAVEGFIRQVLGWREYIRGVYLVEGTSYKDHNAFNHRLSRPGLLYDAKTSLHCLKTAVTNTIRHAYNHHIERLMIIGNLTNLMGIHPSEVRTWFNEMYIDAFDWVVTPNVIGMALHADGGMMSTKPYISSANYIRKMSDYCVTCGYDPKAKTGPDACPVNALYTRFLHRHENKLRRNPRMTFMYANLDKLDEKTLKTLISRAESFIETFDKGGG